MTDQKNPFIMSTPAGNETPATTPAESPVPPETKVAEPIVTTPATEAVTPEVLPPEPGATVVSPEATVVSSPAPAESPAPVTPIVENPVPGPATMGAAVPATRTPAAPPAMTGNSMQPEGVMNLTMDADIKINNLDKLPKLKKDETCRIGFTLFDENNSPLIKMSYYFYDDVAKKLFLAPKNKEVLAQVVNKLGEPKIRFGTPVVLYQTDQYGNMPQQWGYGIYAFIFSTDKFPILKTLHKEWGLQGHDLLMTCSEPEFQKVSMNVGRECMWRTAAPPEVQADIFEKSKLAYEKHLNRFMGRPMPDNEILAMMGLAGPGPGAPGSGPVVNPFPAGAAATAQPAERFAGQVATGTPAQAEFSHLVKTPES